MCWVLLVFFDNFRNQFSVFGSSCFINTTFCFNKKDNLFWLILPILNCYWTGKEISDVKRIETYLKYLWSNKDQKKELYSDSNLWQLHGSSPELWLRGCSYSLISQRMKNIISHLLPHMNNIIFKAEVVKISNLF